MSDQKADKVLRTKIRLRDHMMAAQRQLDAARLRDRTKINRAVAALDDQQFMSAFESYRAAIETMDAAASQLAKAISAAGIAIYGFDPSEPDDEDGAS